MAIIDRTTEQHGTKQRKQRHAVSAVGRHFGPSNRICLKEAPGGVKLTNEVKIFFPFLGILLDVFSGLLSNSLW